MCEELHPAKRPPTKKSGETSEKVPTQGGKTPPGGTQKKKRKSLKKNPKQRKVKPPKEKA